MRHTMIHPSRSTGNRTGRSRRRWGALVAAGALTVSLVACSSGDDAAAGDRTVDVQGHELVIPDHPDRIASIFNASTQPIIELGAADRLVAVQTLPAANVPPANRAAYEAVPNKVAYNTPAEKLVPFDPDLIFSFNGAEKGVNEELGKIAPVAVMQTHGDKRADWQDRTDTIGEILDVPDEAKELKEALTKRQKDISEKYADVLAANTVVFLDSYERGNVFAAGTESMVGDLFTPAGVRFAPSVSGRGGGSDNPGEFTASAEKLGDFLDADIILVGSNFDGGFNELQQALLDNPLLARSDKIKQPIGLATISSYAQANYMLDQLEKALTAAQQK
ncbi:ABC transporter substrate-binding protein [Gordonia sp. VNK21]|uniref:ABC transporter substrate-binding protein n=1 Tax=Gordonia sp. VNK21 TaxID=3382483 RepID=UPI0038D42000